MKEIFYASLITCVSISLNWNKKREKDENFNNRKHFSKKLVKKRKIWNFGGEKSAREGILSEMADLEAVLADVSYLMAMEMSKQTPESSKKIILPDPRWERKFSNFHSSDFEVELESRSKNWL